QARPPHPPIPPAP
nr:RecName: Full=Bradykinin-potentiating peptide AP; Short=BPP-AP; Contains: RecName: Full=Bradykinin-potentiating peptide 11e; Short=BPP-11e [Bothrops fonsecai]